MAVDDDILVKNPFGFQLAGVLVNDAVTREAISKDQMRKFLKFVHDDVVYCKYYEVVYILFHTGMRISEFCGLTLKDIDFENRTVNIDHQLQRTSDMRYIIETTKTDAGTRVLPIIEDVAQMFQAIIEDRNAPKVEKAIDGYSGFLFYDDNGMPLVAMHWQHRFNHMVGRYNDIYRVQLPNITPHVCRHTYCSNMAKSGMNPKTLQYLIDEKNRNAYFDTTQSDENISYIILKSRLVDLMNDDFRLSLFPLFIGGIQVELYDFIEKIVDTRHYYTHYGKTKEEKSLRGIDLQYAIAVLMEVLKICGIVLSSKILLTSQNRMFYKMITATSERIFGVVFLL